MTPGSRFFKQASCRVVEPDLEDEMKAGIRELVDLKSTNPRKGHATGLLHGLCAEADAAGMVLMLMAKPYDQGMTQEQLEMWYGRFGFTVIQQEPRLMARPVRGTRH